MDNISPGMIIVIGTPLVIALVSVVRSYMFKTKPYGFWFGLFLLLVILAMMVVEK